MTQLMTTAFLRSTAQTAGTLSGNGTAIQCAGVNSVLFVIQKSSTGAAGMYTFEVSFDAGQTWAAITCTRLSDGTTASATNAAESGEAFAAPLYDGADVQYRARIST